MFPRLNTAPVATQQALSARILNFLPNHYVYLNTHSSWNTFVTAHYPLELVMLHFIHHMLPHCGAEFVDAKPQDFTFKMLSGGLTNYTFKMHFKNHDYAVRLAGAGSDSFIDRAKEAKQASIASRLGVNPRIIFVDPNNGNQVTEFYGNAEPMSVETLKDFNHIRVLNQLMRDLHESKEPFLHDDDAFERNRKFIALINQKNRLPPNIVAMAPTIDRIERIISTLSLPNVPCHNDTTPGNFLIHKEQREQGKLIDHEYAGQNDPVWDLSNLSMEGEFKTAQDDYLLKDYYQRETIDPIVHNRFHLYQPVVEYYVVLWAQLQIVNRNYIGKKGYDDLVTLREKRFDMFWRVIFSKEYIDAMRYFENRADPLTHAATRSASVGFYKRVTTSPATVSSQEPTASRQWLPQ